MSGRLRLPPLPTLTRVRLWLGYQRYGFVLVGAPVAAVAAAAVLTPWYVALLVALAGLAPARFGVEVLSRWPRKLRATRVAFARIEAGRFSPRAVKPYCGDPCFRLVADEVLARAGTPAAERRRLIRQYGAQLRRERDVLVLVDHVNGTVLTLGGEPDETQQRT